MRKWMFVAVIGLAATAGYGALSSDVGIDVPTVVVLDSAQKVTCSK